MVAFVMSTGADKPALARDTMFAVVMLVLNGFLGLALLLGGEAGVGARRCDEREDRQAEAIGVVHQAHGLAVTLRVGHSKIAILSHLGIGSLLLSNEHDTVAIGYFRQLEVITFGEGV